MTVLSDKQILDNMEKGSVVIKPFREQNLSTSSYDVCLGEWFYREQKPRLSGNVFNIYDPDAVKRVWGEPIKAQTAVDECVSGGPIKDLDRVIVLAPGETILAHTEEFIGGRNNITTMMKARSSLGRSFITVCKCAGWGDVGYTTRWTMEITNVSSEYHIPLVVGERIAQIVFFETGELQGGDYTRTGNYQKNSAEHERSIWTPDRMLPRTKRTEYY